jgi:4-alpha-glucanotransferase
MNEEKKLTGQAGCPPDGFSATGQLWGNPLYAWEYHKETNYDWWKKRISHHQKLFDVIRIDHFRGLDSYYSIPAEDDTAEHGMWVPGPGMDFFDNLKESLGEVNIIAEDLGFLTDSVLKLVKDTGYPGMKVLQFAFDSREAGNYLPHNYIENCIVYTGTHDNNTTRGWFEDLKEVDKAYALEYLGRADLPNEEAADAFIRLAMSSVASLCVIPIQDYLNLDANARINTPSTLGCNWTWRMLSGELTSEMISNIGAMTKLYGR